MTDKEIREYSIDDIMSTARDSFTRVHAGRDAFPNGLSVAMMPALVNWQASSPGNGPSDYYILDCVNLSGNPVSGQSIFGTVRIPMGGIERIEWVFVVSRLGRRENQGGHAMIRFVFKEGRRPIVVSKQGGMIGRNMDIQDLVFSWEAWRPPLAKFDPVAGLDPKTYALSLRCFSGPVRCLSDAVFNRPWMCYTLQFEDVPHAADDVLYKTMLFGDAMARQVYAAMADEQITEAQNAPEGYEDDELKSWKTIRESLTKHEMPESPIDTFLDGQISYHLLERSCVTMALTMLDAANLRVHRRAGLKDPKRVDVAPGKLPAFVEHVSRGERMAALLGLPAALHWLTRKQTVIPGRAHELLDKVGLLKKERGKPVSNHYDNRERTPYGRLEENLIY